MSHTVRWGITLIYAIWLHVFISSFMENNPLIIQCQKKNPTHSDEIVNPVLAIAAKWQGQKKNGELA